MTWGKALIRDVASFVMGQAPPGTEVNEIGLGTPFFRSGEFEDIRPKIAAWTTKPLRLALPTDVFVCVVGANAGEVNRGADGAIGRSIGAVRSGDRLDHDYLYYFLRSIEVYLRNAAQGSAQAVISKDDLGRIEIPLPVLEEQRAIAGVLVALDDKIESNRKLADTLREYGQALLSQVMLQNSTFSPLHSVVASVARGVAPSYVEDCENPLVLNQRCIRNGRVGLTAARRMTHRTVTPERLAQQGDVLVNSTGTGTLGRVARWNGDTIFVDGHVSVVKPDAEKFPPTVLAYLLLSSQTGIEELAEGSTGQTELSPKRLLDFQLSMPKAIDAEKVEPELLDLELRGEKALQESYVLETLRVALLPELLSGRLRVKDAESMMENV